MGLDLSLVPVDESVLHDLLGVAVDEAMADEVTPPLTPGPDWTNRRRQWFLSYHRDRRDQLDGPAAESTWAVLIDGRPVGAVRLRRVIDESTAETGIWLARSTRGRGVGTCALRAVVGKARAAGIARLVADTASTNSAGRAALRSAGFQLGKETRNGRVHGTLDARTTD